MQDEYVILRFGGVSRGWAYAAQRTLVEALPGLLAGHVTAQIGLVVDIGGLPCTPGGKEATDSWAWWDEYLGGATRVKGPAAKAKKAVHPRMACDRLRQPLAV